MIMGTANASDNILTTAVKGLHLLPSSQALAGADIDLLDMENREFRLRNALQAILPYYDYILLDCPPALGFLTINALAAADSVLIPLQCEFFALEGVQQLTDTISVVKEKWNPGLDILGVLLTMYERRYNVTRAVDDDVRNAFGDKVFKTVVPRNVPGKCAGTCTRHLSLTPLQHHNVHPLDMVVFHRQGDLPHNPGLCRLP